MITGPFFWGPFPNFVIGCHTTNLYIERRRISYRLQKILRTVYGVCIETENWKDTTMKSHSSYSEKKEISLPRFTQWPLHDSVPKKLQKLTGITNAR